MRVLNLSQNDYANFSHDNAKALRSVDVHCEDYKTQRHSFDYDSQSKIMELEDMAVILKEFDIIQIFHTDETILEITKGLGLKVVMHHTGTRYRRKPDYYNFMINPFVDLTINALGEFMGLGAFNEVYMVGAVDVPDFKPSYIKEPYKIAHYPSNSEVKGTPQILDMLTKLDSDFELNYDIELVSYKEQLIRTSECEIYIELFKPELQGKPYGSFGITALESAAQGKIVVTQCLSIDIYLATYGYCPLFLPKDRQDFINILNVLLGVDPNTIRSYMIDTYNWVKRNHSYTATGTRLKRLLNEL